MMAGYCATCNNTGYLDCHCGGDLCVCGEEEVECPECGSGFAEDDDDFLLEEGRDAGEWNNLPKVVNVGDELHQILGEALTKTKPQ
jgi:hypothetical protein